MESSSQKAPFAYIFSCYADRHFARELYAFLRRGPLPPILPRDLQELIRNTAINCPERACDAIGQDEEEAIRTTRYFIIICSEKTATTDAEGHALTEHVSRLFLESAPDAKKRLIAVILRSDTSQRAEQYMPTSVQALHHLGLDSAVKSKKRIFSDILAHFADMRPSSLWDRGKLERRKKLRFDFMKGALFLLLLSGIIYLIRSDFLTTEAYFADYTYRHGEPLGIIPLTEQEIARMHRHYRFTYHYGNVQKIELCNSSGCLQDDTDALFGYYRPCVVEVKRGAGLTLIEKDSKGEVIRTLSQLSENTFRMWKPDNTFSDWPALMEGGFLHGREAPFRHVECYRCESDNEGYLTRVDFIGEGNDDGTAADCSTGRSIIRNPYAENRIALIGEPLRENAANEVSAHHIEYSYNPPSQGGMIRDFRIIGDNEAQSGIGTQFHYTWSPERNLSAITCCDSNNVFLYRTLFTYDSRGNRIRESHVNLIGEPLNVSGYCDVIYTYDEGGRLTSVTRTDTKGHTTRKLLKQP